MAGFVDVDQRACKCGGKFKKETFRKQAYFTCADCGGDPILFRVRRYLPGLGPTDIRYDQNGKRLKDIDSARATMKYIDGLISTGQFDPAEFGNQENNLAIFENFIQKKYLPHYEARQRNGEFKPSSMAAKRQYLKNHLLPYFTGKSIKKFNDGTITDMYAELKASDRMKDLIAQELKTILGYAKKHKVISDIPSFPKMKKAKLKDPELFLTYKQQQQVIDHIDDERYKVMIQILCLIAIRPGEVRALKWSDWDFKKGILWIRRHVTHRSIVISGRKSNDDVHSIRINSKLLEIIRPVPRSLDQDAYMFPGDNGEIASEHCLSRAWKKAVKLAELPHVDLYRGSKSSRLSQMLRAGKSLAEISVATGISIEAVKRYAQHNEESFLDLQDDLFSMEG